MEIDNTSNRSHPDTRGVASISPLQISDAETEALLVDEHDHFPQPSRSEQLWRRLRSFLPSSRAKSGIKRKDTRTTSSNKVDHVLPSVAAESTTPLWLVFCGKMAPISSIILYMAPIPTVQELSRRKLVGNLPLLPYTSMLSNSFSWSVYGLMVSEPKLWTANAVGLILSIYYFLTFARFTPNGAQSLPGTLEQHIQGFVSILAFVLWMAKSKKSGPIGKLGVAINMAMYASPLAAIQAVVESKSSEAIPLPLTVASLMSCVFWTITGYLEMHDPYVWVPTIFGMIFGIMQVGLKLVYNEKSPALEAEAGTNNLSPELNSEQVIFLN